MAISRKLFDYWCGIGEGSDLYWLDSGTAGEDDILTGVDSDEPLRDVLFHIDAQQLPEGWEITPMDLNEFQARMDNYSFGSPLGNLRKFSGWHAVAQPGPDSDLPADTECVVNADGSVTTVESGAILVEEPAEPFTAASRQWFAFLANLADHAAPA